MEKYSETLIKEIFNSPFVETFKDALKYPNNMNNNELLNINQVYSLLQYNAIKDCIKNGTKYDIEKINEMYCIVINTAYQKGKVIIPEYIIKQYFEFKNKTKPINKL